MFFSIQLTDQHNKAVNYFSKLPPPPKMPYYAPESM